MHSTTAVIMVPCSTQWARQETQLLSVVPEDQTLTDQTTLQSHALAFNLLMIIYHCLTTWSLGDHQATVHTVLAIFLHYSPFSFVINLCTIMQPPYLSTSRTSYPCAASFSWTLTPFASWVSLLAKSPCQGTCLPQWPMQTYWKAC